jgi:hypothetical protein
MEFDEIEEIIRRIVFENMTLNNKTDEKPA